MRRRHLGAQQNLTEGSDKEPPAGDSNGLGRRVDNRCGQGLLCILQDSL